MTEKSDLLARRNAEQKRIRMMLNAMRSEERAKIQMGDFLGSINEEISPNAK